MEDSLMYEPEATFFQRHLEKAADVYDRLNFVDPGSAYNNEPPEPWISVRVVAILAQGYLPCNNPLLTVMVLLSCSF
jgi:hypothetical protein